MKYTDVYLCSVVLYATVTQINTPMLVISILLWQAEEKELLGGVNVVRG